MEAAALEGILTTVFMDYIEGKLTGTLSENNEEVIEALGRMEESIVKMTDIITENNQNVTESINYLLKALNSVNVVAFLLLGVTVAAIFIYVIIGPLNNRRR